MGPYASYLVETSITLVLVAGIAVLVLLGARRLGLARPSGAIRLVGQLPLDARRAIYVVKVGDLALVVGSSEAGMTKLGELPGAAVPEPATLGKPLRFSEALARAVGGAFPAGSLPPDAPPTPSDPSKEEVP